MRNDTCLKDNLSYRDGEKYTAQEVLTYGTEITELGHCLGVGNEGRGKNQRISCSVIELILMPFTQKVAYRS